MASSSSRAKVLPYVNAGPTRVTVTIRHGSKTLPMLQHGTKLYVVAVPGEEFRIHVARSCPTEDDPAYMVSGQVDGQLLGYYNLMQPANGACDLYYMMGAPGAAPGEGTRFKFEPLPAADSATAAVVEDPDAIQFGRIKVTIHARGAPASNPSTPAPAAPTPPRSQASPVSLPDGKKFFMAPSLSCGQGSSIGEVKWSSTRYNWGAYLGSVELHYETAATLVLRKVLDARVPEHQSIIQEYGLQAAPAVAGQSAAAPATNVTQAQREGAGERGRPLKRRAADAGSVVGRRVTRNTAKASTQAAEVKPEMKPEVKCNVKSEAGSVANAGQAGGGPRAGPARRQMAVLDLTADPLVVNGQELHKGQMAVCDLTDEEGASQQEQAAWQVVDKVTEKVTLD